MTHKYGVIGDPIAHSMSPMIHRLWYQELNINATYDPIQVSEGMFPEALKALTNQGFLGLNVTLPHKHAALDCAVKASHAAETIGAANTLSICGNRDWTANNTDSPGFLMALSEAGLTSVKGKRVTVLGAGGSSRAVVYALHKEKAEITILNRTVARAQKLSEEVTGSMAVYGSLDQLTDYLRETDLVVNTTSMGYEGGILHLSQGRGRLFCDISYGKTALPQLQAAHSAGWQTADGLFMLVAQAAESFKIWFDKEPDIQSAFALCKKATEKTA